MPRMIALVAVFVLCGLVGCVTENLVEARPEASKVTVVKDVDKPLHCRNLGDVNGRSRSQDTAKARAGAQNDFKNRAAALKANYALIEDENGGHVGTSAYTEVLIRGKALLCEEPAAPSEQ